MVKNIAAALALALAIALAFSSCMAARAMAALARGYAFRRRVCVVLDRRRNLSPCRVIDDPAIPSSLTLSSHRFTAGVDHQGSGA